MAVPAAAVASSSASSAGAGAAGGPIALAVVLALVITKEIFKARRTARREMLAKKYPPIQVETAAQRLKNLLGENGEALAVAQILTPEQQMQMGVLQPDFSYSYSEPVSTQQIPRSRQQILQDLGISSTERQQELRAKTGPIQAPGKTNPNWAHDLANILLNITGGNLNKLNPNSLLYNEYYNLMMKVASGEADEVFKNLSNNAFPNLLPKDWRGNAYFSANGTFLGIDLTGNSTSNNQIIIINEPLPNGFYLDPKNKIINPNSMLTIYYEYLDVFLLRNKNKMGFDKIAERIFTRIGESVGVQNGVTLGGDAPINVPAYTDPYGKVHVNEDLLEDFWKDYRNINAARNLLYHESLHQQMPRENYYDHAYIYLLQLQHESFPNSGTDYQVEQIKIFSMYVLRAAKEPGAYLEKVKQLFIDFNNNLVNLAFEIQYKLDVNDPYVIIYGERINYTDEEVQDLPM